MSFLVNNAYADDVTTTSSTSTSSAAGTLPQGDIIGMVLPFVFIFIVFYFLILRPQQRKYKMHQAMVSGIRRGDNVVTSGGILGKVAKVDTDAGVIQVEIADDVTVKILASTITTVVNDKPTNDNSVDKNDKKEKI